MSENLQRYRDAVYEAAIAWFDSHEDGIAVQATTMARGYLYDRIKYLKNAERKEALDATR